MNDHKDNFGCRTHRKIEVPQKEFTIHGHKVSEIKKEDVENFCAARLVPVEWFVNELIKEMD